MSSDKTVRATEIRKTALISLAEIVTWLQYRILYVVDKDQLLKVVVLQCGYATRAVRRGAGVLHKHFFPSFMLVILITLQ
jgi:hypothetical protein